MNKYKRWQQYLVVSILPLLLMLYMVYQPLAAALMGQEIYLAIASGENLQRYDDGVHDLELAIEYLPLALFDHLKDSSFSDAPQNIRHLYQSTIYVELERVGSLHEAVAVHETLPNEAGIYLKAEVDYYVSRPPYQHNKEEDDSIYHSVRVDYMSAIDRFGVYTPVIPTTNSTMLPYATVQVRKGYALLTGVYGIE